MSLPHQRCWYRFLVLVLLASSAGVAAEVASGGELLYNGIRLPDTWPPRLTGLGREPMPVPYLKQPPEVIPIDVGRQLFVDDFLVQQTTLNRTFHKLEYHGPVLTADKPWESGSHEDIFGRRSGHIAAPFSDGVWYDPTDKLFKIWYSAAFYKLTCYATSKDGIHWDKPSLDVEPGTNIVIRHSSASFGRGSQTVWIDDRETDSKKRFKMFETLPDPDHLDNFEFLRFGLRFSPDGIHWSEPILRPQSPRIGDRTTAFYNPFRKVWVWSIKGAGAGGEGRARAYREHVDALIGTAWQAEDVYPWAYSDRLDPRNPNPELSHINPQLYNLDAVGYESLMLGLFSIWQGGVKDKPKRNEVLLGFSRDGFHWDRPDRTPFAHANEKPGAWNWGNIQSAGGGCLVVGDKLFFYVMGWSENNTTTDRTINTGLGVLRRDGFASMDAGPQEGVLTTRLIQFSGKYLFVNADAVGGQLQAEVLDRNGAVIEPFSRANSVPMSSDSTTARLSWKGVDDLSRLVGQPVKLRFYLTNGDIYSFWVSPDQSGASYGHVGAGGPGFAGPIDTVGTSGKTPVGVKAR